MVWAQPMQKPAFQLVELPDHSVSVSPHFGDWLAGQEVSLAFTSSLENRLFLIGIREDGRLSVVEEGFDRCMGMAAVGIDTLYLVLRFQIWRLENILPPGHCAEGGYDRFYLPQMGYTTGRVNMHDVAVDGLGRLVFVNTAFDCLAQVDEHDNFLPLWRPHFLSALPLALGDCCHLNGVAIKDGQIAYATCFSQSATPGGWREHKLDGGAVVDVMADDTILTGLCMPHSPRFYHDRLWLAESGTGRLGWVDVERERFEPVAYAPGYLRGLSFVGNFAVVGSSKPRHGDFFDGLPLQERLDRGREAACHGLFVVNLSTGDVEHWLRLEGGRGEVYDVLALPGVRQPKAAGVHSSEAQKMVTVGVGAGSRE